jgi:predicted dinucleotide-binding enzyme
VAKSLHDALEDNIIIFAVQFLNFKDVGSAKPDWTGKIVVDVTNAAFLPQEVQDRELQGRLSSQVNAERVPGAELVKAFNDLPMNVLSSSVPDGGKRVVFISSDHEDASAKVARLAEKLGFAPIEVGEDRRGRPADPGKKCARVSGPHQIRKEITAQRPPVSGVSPVNLKRLRHSERWAIGFTMRVRSLAAFRTPEISVR